MAAMVAEIADFEYIVTDTEVEALILESNLIKRYRPWYNVRLRDDKAYPYIKVTLEERFPRVIRGPPEAERRGPLLRPLHQRPRGPGDPPVHPEAPPGADLHPGPVGRAQLPALPHVPHRPLRRALCGAPKRGGVPEDHRPGAPLPGGPPGGPHPRAHPADGGGGRGAPV